MLQNIVLNKAQKEALIKASQSVGLSYSSFMRQAVIEKMSKMGIHVNTSQGANMDSSAPNTLKDGVDANGRT